MIKGNALLRCLIACALVPLGTRTLRAQNVTYKDFQIQGCQGTSGQNFYNANPQILDPSGNIITHTSNPQFFIWITTAVSPPYLVANQKNPSGTNPLPNLSATTLGGVQNLWNFDTATGIGFDTAVGATNLNFAAGPKSTCANDNQGNSPNGLLQSFQASTTTTPTKPTDNLCSANTTAVGPNFKNFSSFTVEAWVKVNGNGCNATNCSGTGDWPIFDECPANGTTDQCLHIVLRQEAAGACNGPAQGTVGNFTPYFGFFGDDVCGGNIADSNWHHLAFVYNGSLTAKGIYLDGNLVSGGDNGTSAAYQGAAATAYIGGVPTGAGTNEDGQYANGWIDGVRVWNIALTAGTAASHALGQWYSINTSSVMVNTSAGGLSGGFIPNQTTVGTSPNFIQDEWAFGNGEPTSDNIDIIPTQGGQDTIMGMVFNEEDTSENINSGSTGNPTSANNGIVIRQMTMTEPPSPMFYASASPTGQYTLNWSMPQWFCYGTDTSYNYALTDLINGGTLDVTGGTTAGGEVVSNLKVNVRYGLTAAAKYTDNAPGNGNVMTSVATPSISTTTLTWPPAKLSGLTISGGNSLIMTMTNTQTAEQPPTLCPNGGASCPNPAYTVADVEGSNNNGATYNQFAGYAACDNCASNPASCSPAYPAIYTCLFQASNLAYSSQYLFQARTANLDGVISAAGLPTGTPTLNGPGITQPEIPGAISGTTALGTAGLTCPKNQVLWSWGEVPIGSNQLPLAADTTPQYALVNNLGAAINATGTFPGTFANHCTGNCQFATYYLETGLTPNTAYFAKVYAFDPGASISPDIRFSSSTGFATATTQSAQNFAPTQLIGTAGSGEIQWTWTAPPNLCFPDQYNVYDTHTGIRLTFFDSNSPTQTFIQTLDAHGVALGPNAQSSIVVDAYDTVGSTGPLSLSATSYTEAFPPQNLAFGGVSTGGIAVSWNANGNPGYTRYELSMSLDNFTHVISTPVPISANYTGTSVGVSALSPGTTYYFRVRAIDGEGGDAFGTTFTNFTPVGSIQTLYSAPILTASNPTLNSITWSWSTGTLAGVSAFQLYQAPSNALMASFTPPYAGAVQGILSYTEGALGANVQAGAYVLALNGQGLASPVVPVYAYTLANGPTALPVVGVTSNTISYAWNPNGNPVGTFYEVDVDTNPLFTNVIATVTIANTAVTVTGLFPGTTYFGQVRAYNGNLVPSSGYAQFASTDTNSDPIVTLSSAPATVYAIPTGAVGVWHFDESSGTVASDSSPYYNSGFLTCLYNGCTSTPTWISGPSGLGSAVEFAGAASSFVLIPDSAPWQYHFPGSLTLEAWVDPTTVAQANGAGIVAWGPFDSEGFFMDVTGGKYRFSACPLGGGGAAVTTSALQTGQWTRLVGTYNSGTGAQTLYVNGAAASPAVSCGGRVLPGDDISTVTVGNRQSGTGAYDLGFNGAIDEVRIINGLLTPTQVLQDYASSFASSVTLIGGSAGLQLVVPPDAFGGPATIYASDDPVNHPLKISVTELLNGLSNPPTGQMLVPGMLVEIVPVVNGEQFTGPLGSSVTIIMGYPNASNNGIIDGTNPPIAASTLKFYTLNTSIGQWVQLPSSVDTLGHTVIGITPHFSVFGAFGAVTTGTSVSQARVYPDPWKQGSGGRFDATALTFDTLPSAGYIRIFTLSGQKVIDLPFEAGNAGAVQWNGQNQSGRPVASGVYFAYIQAQDNSTRIIKFAIER